MIPLPVGIAPPSIVTENLPVDLTIWDTTGTRQILVGDSSPCVTVAGGAYAEPAALQDSILRQTGLQTALMRVVDAHRIEVELIDSVPLPDSWHWCEAELTEHPKRAPWERPGWCARTLDRVDRILADLGMVRTGPAKKMRHTSVTSLLRFPTDRGPVWLKAIRPICAHEAGVIRVLSEFAPDEVPQILATTDDWWLAVEFPPPAPNPAGDPLVTLARMQIAAVERRKALDRAGCLSRPLHALGGEMAGIAVEDDLLGSSMSRTLRAVLSRLEDALGDLNTIGVPYTLVHGDLSPGNVLWSARGWLIYDWTDACIAHPFIDLASPLSYEIDTCLATTRAQTYAAAWAAVLPARDVERALMLSATVGASNIENGPRVLP